MSIAVVGPILLCVDGLHMLRRFGPYELLGVTLAHSLGQVVILAVPAAIAVATLKYQLFEVDRLINRTLVYTMLTAALVLVYFSSVVLLQQIVGAVAPQESGGVPVVSTLAIAALFQPLRRRVQVTIDRRFYRHKYDAIRTLQTLNTTLRNEVDLQILRSHLLDVVEETMRPAHLSLWLRDDSLDWRRPS